MRYGLILNGKKIDDLKTEIFVKSEYSIAEMMDILKNYPCELKDESEILNLARYLIEDNNSDYVEYDPERR